MKKVFSLLLVLVVALLAFAAPTHLVILHVNDSHGHVWTYKVGNDDVGGFAKIQTLVKQIREQVRAEGGDVVLLGAGDVNTGIPESDQVNAAADFSVMNFMNFDAMALGNHEFDKPFDVLQKQSRIAGFPFLSSNFVDKKGSPVFKPYIIKEVAGLRVGIIGATTEQSEVLESQFLGTNKFLNVVDTVNKYLPAVKANSDVTIVLGHLGYKEKPVLPVKFTTSEDLAAAVNGLDVIVDGHTHSVLNSGDLVNNTLIAQAGEWGKFLGRVDLWVENGKVVKKEASLIPINGKIKDDPLIKTVSNIYLKMGAEKLNAVIGKTEILLDGERNNVRSKETNLGHLIADAQSWKTGADISIANGGGIRASIQPGNITYRNILTVLPFGNTVAVQKLSGKEVMELLAYVVKIPAGQGAKTHVAGITFDSVGGVVSNVLIKGQPIDLDKTYTLVTNDYMAAGGDGYTMLKGKPTYNTGYVLADVVKDYIISLGTIKNYDNSNRMNIK